VEGAVATVAAIDIAGDGGRSDLVALVRAFEAIRGRGTGIRVGVVESLIWGGTGSPGPLRVGMVWNEDGGLAQREADGIVLFVGVVSDCTELFCSKSFTVLAFPVSVPDPIAFVILGAGGRMVILLTTFGEPGVTPGSCN
jgi:hypothetical protein